MKLTAGILLSLTVFCFEKFPAQVLAQRSCFNQLYIDKPMMQADSEAIIKAGIKTICLYELVMGDSLPLKTKVGEWSINLLGNRIQSLQWHLSDGFYKNSPYSYLGLTCDSLKSRTRKGKRIIDFVGDTNKGSSNYSYHILTHFLDKEDRIYKTVCKRKGFHYEDRYHFDEIRYEYLDGFVTMLFYKHASASKEVEAYSTLLYEYRK